MTVVTLKLNLEQARVVSNALDLYSRLGIGQLEEIAWLVKSDEIPMFTQGVTKPKPAQLTHDLIQDKLYDIKQLLMYPTNASYGIGAEHVPVSAKRGYEVKKVLDKALAEYSNPNPDFKGVNYDGLIVRYTRDKEPKVNIK